MQHWKMETDARGICWLTLDRADSSTNTLGHEVLQEFHVIIDAMTELLPRGLVIRSGKSNGFIAGADIAEFTKLKTQDEATEVIRKAQMIFDKLAKLPVPTVAMINGFCLGGGLELALACKYRVMLDNPKAKIGLPEILLGVQPGWGGSIRLPRLIGSIPALNMILAGKLVDPRQAAKIGLIDAAVPERHFKAAVEYYVQMSPETKDCGIIEKIIELSFMRRFIGNILKQKVVERVNPQHYPAPFKVIDTWINNSIFSPGAFVAEAESIGSLLVTPTAQNLVRVFFLRDRLKSFAKQKTEFKPQHVHVVGAGVMGGDIAAWCAASGFTVTVQDQNMHAIAATLDRAQKLFNKNIKLPFLVQAAKDRLIADPEGLGIPKADLIIEAIIEDATAKQQLFGKLAKIAKPEALLATNTSTIPLATISKNLPDPSRLVGIHFFNPVAQMQLVEVVSDPHTNPQVVANAMAFVGKIDKLPLPVLSVPGFLVNRVLMPYILESAEIYAEGVPGQIIDRAATDFGMMMGPIELMDIVGLDVCKAAAMNIGATVPDFINKWIAEGRVGKKSGKGFYNYDKKGKRLPMHYEYNQPIPADLTDRLIMRLVNEAAACLREGVVADADLVDAGLVFGAGFAPFRGGPMAYVASQQKPNIKNRLQNLMQRYGKRFAADPAWS